MLRAMNMVRRKRIGVREKSLRIAYFTSCCVIVEPPWAPCPERMSTIAARSSEMLLTPSCR